jgi:hypothetical protein
MASLLMRRVDLVVRICAERDRIEQVSASASDADLTDEDLIELQTADLVALPDPLLDAILAGVAAERPDAIARAYPRRLEVVGGRDAE